MKGKLEEGKIYPFVISDLINIPNDQEYIKLIDPNNIKHLLEAGPYVKYNFKKGNTIHCRVDKINCTGKIFIEPEHPYYDLNEIYEFLLIRFGKSNTDTDLKHSHAYFLDVFKNEVEFPIEELEEDLIPGNSYKFQVTRIKKGLIYISQVKDKNIYKNFKVGNEYPFTISKLRNYAHKYTYYILQGPYGNEYKLRSKFYANYNLRLGESIYCRLLDDGDEKYLEPRHPQYEIGKEYDFEIIREDFINDYPNDQLEVIVLRNNFGKEQFIPKAQVSPNCIKNRKIKCMVMDIRKSRLFLECGVGV